MPVVTCPSCSGQMEVDEADLGHELECPHCAARFTPPKPKVLRRTSTVDKAFRDDDDDDRPRRRKRRRTSYYDPPDAYERSIVVEKGRTCGLWHLIAGYGGVLLYISIGLAFFITGMVWMNQPKKPFANPNEGEGPAIFGCVLFVLGTITMIPTILAGHQLRRINTARSITWVYISMRLGVFAAVTCLVWPVTWAMIGFGIWGLVFVSDPKTQRVLRDNNAPKEETEDDAEL